MIILLRKIDQFDTKIYIDMFKISSFKNHFVLNILPKKYHEIISYIEKVEL